MKARAGAVNSGRVRRALGLLVAFAVTGGAVTAVASAHLIFNRTASMPVGLYRKLTVDHAPARGDIVLICAPEAVARFGAQRGFLPPGDCALRTAPLLKHVAAVGGDLVQVRADAVLVNGVPLPNSATRSTDLSGRPLPHVRPGRYVLRRGQVWLWTRSPIGWDSRYYGPLAVRDIRAFAVPFAVLPQR